MPDGPRKIRFGVFEADFAAGELRRNGVRVKLQEQPFQVLAALLKKPGAVVSKEELQEKIWKEDTYVDFDRSLATAVNKIRQALGDSATRPRFIETEPRRGYRFLAEPGGDGVSEPVAETTEHGQHRRTPNSDAVLMSKTLSNRSWNLVTTEGADRGATGAVAKIESSSRFASGINYAHHWDSEGFVYYSNDTGEGADLWRIRVEPESGRVEGSSQRVLTAPGRFDQAALAGDGRLVFASQTENQDLWSVAADSNRGAITDLRPVRLTSGPERERDPYLSRDGRLLAFSSERSGERQVRLVDFETGDERPLFVSYRQAVLNASGTRLADITAPEPGGGQMLRIRSLIGGFEKQFPLAIGRGNVWHWSPNDAWILCNYREQDAPYSAILLVDADTGASTGLLSDDDTSLWQPRFSPDGDWLAWQSASDGIKIAPFSGSYAIPREQWIQISEHGVVTDKPRWSPDGGLLYYISDRDGSFCIYAQPLAPETKEPSGELREIYHAHDTRTSIGNEVAPYLDFDVAQGKIVFPMTELTGNIWMMDRVLD